MQLTTVAPFYLMGLAIRTTNENGQSAADIPKLWDRFFSENIIDSISDKQDDTLYCAYTDYVSDHTQPYTTVLGCRVHSLNDIPEGLTGIAVEGGNYRQFSATGRINDGIVFQVWTSIWNAYIPRVYTTDFEVYGVNAQDPEHAEVPIFVAVV